MTPEMIDIGPLTLTRKEWSQFKYAIRTAFGEWDAWAGGRGNVDEQEEYRSTVAKEHDHVFTIIDRLEDVGAGKPHP